MKFQQAKLSRRERQIMEIVYRLEQATAKEVLHEMDDPPSYTSVRTHLRLLEEKGYLKHRTDGVRYLYSPTVGKEKARTSAVGNVLKNFFSGSHHEFIATLIDEGGSKLSSEELDHLSALIEKVKREGR